MNMKIKPKIISIATAAILAGAGTAGSIFAQERGGAFVDERDGQVYRYVAMPDGKTWMAQNLNFATDEGSWCYDNDVANCEIYGRLYDWNTAMTACPQGWRLPTHEDWQALINSVGDWATAGTKLKSETGWIDVVEDYKPGTNDFGFSTLPGGFRWTSDNFSDIGSAGLWWATTEDNMTCKATRAQRWGMRNYSEFVGVGWRSKSNGFSVRCVRDD